MASNPPSTGPFGLPRIVVWAGGVLLLILVSFGAGFAVGRRPIGDLTRRMEQADTRTGETEAQAAELEARLHAHRALALLYQTIVDVDARNFGTANERLDEVVATLDRVDRERLGASGEELGAVRNELEGLDIRVAADLAGQRATLSGLAQRLAVALGG